MVMVVLFQRQTADRAVEVIQSIMQVCCAGMAHCLDEAGSREML